MNKELRRCPFCGGEATTSHGVERITMEPFFFVSCEYCQSRTRKFHKWRYGEEYERKAIEAWNRREPIDRIVEQLENASCYIEDGDGHAGHLVFTDEAIEIVKKGGAV